MSEIRANSITDAAGTGAPNFPNGLTVNGGPVSGTQTFTATGALSNGDLVGINADGTVSVVTPVFGGQAVFEDASAVQTSVAYDPVNGKVVVAYLDAGNSSYRTAVVGTVSGTSISFGTPVVFLAATPVAQTACVFDSASGKFVIAYTNASSHGTAIVGTVSGTTISFGSAVTFEAAVTSSISAAYHSASQKVVISYQDQGNSSFGTAIVGTVSGTSISFGAAAVFESAATNYTSCVYDTANDKIVIFYQDVGNSSFGTVAVGTVSGTSISFGTPVVFVSNGAVIASRGATYDSVSGRVVLLYNIAGVYYAIAGTVSGTSISFGTALLLGTNSASFAGVCSASGGIITAVIIDTVYQLRVVGSTVVLGDTLTRTGAGNHITDGVSIVAVGSGAMYVFRGYFPVNPAGVAQFINLSSPLVSWVGVAAESIANGADGKVTVVGGIVSGLSGLTSGLTYGIPYDTATLTAGPTNAIGLAISATELYINTGRIE